MKMITLKDLKEMEELFSMVGSWSIWDIENVENMDWVNDVKNGKIVLKTNYVFVGLNWSGVDYNAVGPWSGFHASVWDAHLRDALMGTKFQGCYITDIVKCYPESVSSEVVFDEDEEAVQNAKGKALELWGPKGIISKNDTFKDMCKKVFLKELEYLDDDVKIIAMGNKAYEILWDMFPDKKKNIYKIRHYSRSSKNYPVEVQSQLKAIP